MRSRLFATPLFALAAICLASTGTLAQSTSTTGSGVQVGALGDATPDYAGTLEEGGGGFPMDMWKGTDRALVERLLPKLPPALGSPAMRDLERRLLLTNAESPEGNSTGSACSPPARTGWRPWASRATRRHCWR